MSLEKWHLFGVCHHSARSFHLAILGWSAHLFVAFFFLFCCTRRSRFKDPRTRWKRRSGHSLWYLYNATAAIRPTFFFFFLNLRSNKTCSEWLWCYCSGEIDSLMRPFSENATHMNYNELCSCLHLLWDEGGGGREEGAELLLKIHQQCYNKSQLWEGFFIYFYFFQSV